MLAIEVKCFAPPSRVVVGIGDDDDVLWQRDGPADAMWGRCKAVKDAGCRRDSADTTGNDTVHVLRGVMAPTERFIQEENIERGVPRSNKMFATFHEYIRPAAAATIKPPP